jgi:hypothetical protein
MPQIFMVTDKSLHTTFIAAADDFPTRRKQYHALASDPQYITVTEKAVKEFPSALSIEPTKVETGAPPPEWQYAGSSMASLFDPEKDSLYRHMTVDGNTRWQEWTGKTWAGDIDYPRGGPYSYTEDQMATALRILAIHQGKPRHAKERQAAEESPDPAEAIKTLGDFAVTQLNKLDTDKVGRALTELGVPRTVVSVLQDAKDRFTDETKK